MHQDTVVLPGGRQIGYCSVGEGKPVMYFHGTASSRLEVLLLEDLARIAQLQIICIDRPGYGLSAFHPWQHIQDFNADVNQLADHFGVERFGVLGWSGGGVFVLAYLAGFPERVTKAVVAGAPSLPFDVSTAHNMPLARFIMKVPFAGYFAVKEMSRQVLGCHGDVSAFLRSRQGRQMLNGCSQSDLKFFRDSSWMKMMLDSMVEAFRQGNDSVKAVLSEHQAFMKPWSFTLSNVPEGKLVVWHGSEDRTCRVANAHSIAGAVAGSHLEVFEGAGHCVMFENFEKLGNLLASDDR